MQMQWKLKGAIANMRSAVPSCGKAFILSALMVAGCSGACQRQAEKAEKGDSTFLYQSGPAQKEKPVEADSTKTKKEEIIKSTPKVTAQIKDLEKFLEERKAQGDSTSTIYKEMERRLSLLKKGVNPFPSSNPSVEKTQQVEDDLKGMEKLLEELRAKGDTTSSLYRSIQNRYDLTKKGIEPFPSRRNQ